MSYRVGINVLLMFFSLHLSWLQARRAVRKKANRCRKGSGATPWWVAAPPSQAGPGAQSVPTFRFIFLTAWHLPALEKAREEDYCALDVFPRSLSSSKTIMWVNHMSQDPPVLLPRRAFPSQPANQEATPRKHHHLCSISPRICLSHLRGHSLNSKTCNNL